MTSSHSELLTLRDLLRWAVSRFRAAGLVFGHGNDNAWDEAAHLLLHCLHLPPDLLEPFLDARLLERERERCIEQVHERISSRKPVAYLTGEAWLQGERFLVDERVIVPRSPIAELLSDALEPWLTDPDATRHVLDLCTGSGCLGILAAKAFPRARVTLADLSEDALEVARRNIALHGLEARVTAHTADLFEGLDSTRPYDLILCNPPYVTSAAMDTLPPEYQHEPALALAGGQDGMDIVRRILAQAPAFMTPDALLVLEVGHERAHFEAAFPRLAPIWVATAALPDAVLLLRRQDLGA